MSPLVHLLLSFFKAHEAGRNIPLSQIRDALPVWLVTAALVKLGFGLGSVKLNHPPSSPTPGERMKIDVSDLRRGDVLLSGSRSAKGDDEDAPRKNMPRGYSTLEQCTDRVWWRYFAALTRMEMTLQPWLRSQLSASFGNRGKVRFMQSERADYSLLTSQDDAVEQKVRGMGRTAAFLVNQPELWPDGPTYIGFFGMSGAATLAWAYLLQQRHSDLLLRPGFHMVELTTTPIPVRVPDLSWALGWSAEVILSVPPASGPKEIFLAQDTREEVHA